MKVNRAMTLEEFSDRLMDVMPRLMRVMHGEDRNLLASGHITMPQLWVLLHLAEQGACPMRDVARRAGLKGPTITNLMDRLVKLGLVNRVGSPEDRRVVLASLTPKGRAVLRQMREEKMKTFQRLFKTLSPRERGQYLDILGKIVERFSNEEL